MGGKGGRFVDGFKAASHYISSIPEPMWMARVKAGDPEILRFLLARYVVPLRRFAARFLGGRGDPEAVVQEAFIRLWEKRDHWREDGSVKALLFTLTRNAAVDGARGGALPWVSYGGQILVAVPDLDIAIALNSSFSDDQEEADVHADIAWDLILNHIIPSAH